MLADRWDDLYQSLMVESAQEGLAPPPEHTNAMEEMIRAVQRAARFRLDDQAVGLVQQAASRPGALVESSPYLSWPAAPTWLEFKFAACMVGVLFRSEQGENLKRGQLMVSLWMRNLSPLVFYAGSCLGEAAPFPWIDEGRQLKAFQAWKRANGLRSEDTLSDEELLRFRGVFGWIVLGALALLNSPKTVRVVEADLTRLNKARLKARKPPLLSYREVLIDLAKVERLLREGDVAEETGIRHQRHFVRWHLRLVRGVLYPVRPHWRGDPSLGVKAPPAYHLTAKEGASHGTPRS